MRIKIRVCLALVALAFMAARSAHAGYEYVGRGFRAVAMGQAQVAVANDSAGVTYNPAALVYGREHWDLQGKSILVQIGQTAYMPVLRINGVDQDYWFTPSTTIGALIPIGRRITLGLQIDAPDGMILKTVIIEGPGWNRFRPPGAVSVTFAFGVKITDKFSLGYKAAGAALEINAAPITVDINGVLMQLGLPLGEPNVNINPHMEIDILPGGGGGFVVGGLYRPFKWLNLGAVYSTGGLTEISIPVYLPPGLLPETRFTISGNAGDEPITVMGGIGLFPDEHITIAFDLIYRQYSKTRPYFTRILNDDPNSIIPATDYPDVTLTDTIDPRVGFEYRNNLKGKYSRFDYAFRGGYSFTNSPFPTATTELQGVDSDAHIIAGGFALGYRPKKRFEYLGIEYFFEYLDAIERTHRDIDMNPPVKVSDGYVIYYGGGLTVKL